MRKGKQDLMRVGEPDIQSRILTVRGAQFMSFDSHRAGLRLRALRIEQRTSRARGKYGIILRKQI